MKKKLYSHRGETLVESVVAVLVISLASVALATMLNSASHLNKTAQEKDTELYEAVSAAETKPDEQKIGGTVSVTVGGSKVEKPVFFYCSDADDPIYSYRME